jgi:hypothetical protein
MHNVKHSEASKQKMREAKLKKYAEKPMDIEWKKKIGESNKATYAKMKKEYEIQTYGWAYLEMINGKVWMKATYGNDYQTKYRMESNMNM